MVAKLWVDVEDLFEYAADRERPSGIQRLAFEIYKNLQERFGQSGNVNFVRHGHGNSDFRIVQWVQIAALFEDLSSSSRNKLSFKSNFLAARKRSIRGAIKQLPAALRDPITKVLAVRFQASRSTRRFLSLSMWGLGRHSRRFASAVRGGTPPEAEATDFYSLTAPGDILVAVGSPWGADYSARVAAWKQRGMKFASLIYDLIPIRHPEWCDAALARSFREWLGNVLPLCDHVFAISKATAADIERYAREAGIALPGPVATIPIGSGFSVAQHSSSTQRSALLSGLHGDYVLMVSTIEARKNHLLMFQVWRRMLDEMPREKVPTLVFAGRVGWLVEDLMRQIASTGNLGGKLLLIENPTDADLVHLYDGCLFTVFPSFFEGWGLPVTESLSHGKPCAISNRTSLPEAGGRLARYFDPDDLDDAYAVVTGAIENREQLAQWEAQVRREFRQTSWSETVDALLKGLGRSPTSTA